MNTKYIGMLFILASGVFLFWQLRQQGRGELLFLQDMASALEQMESSVRFRCLPMPELLGEEAKRQYCGQLFASVIQAMQSGRPLQESWAEAVSCVPWEPAGTMLSSLRLAGDRQRISENLRLCAADLRGLLAQRRKGCREQQKLNLAAIFSGCGLLLILLL